MNQEGGTSNVFAEVGNQMIADREANASQGDAQKDQHPSDQAPQQAAQAIAELDKMDKFKLDGQEWTLTDLKAAIMRQKDYTQKTQSLSQERKAFDEDRKFAENLHWDLINLSRNPSLVEQFIKTYPAKYHTVAGEWLKNNAPQGASEQKVQQQNQPQVPIELLSKVDEMSKFLEEQKVTKAESEIEKITQGLFQKYPDANKKFAKEVVFARAFEAHSQGLNLDANAWESIVKEVADEIKSIAKTDYAEKVKKQTEANSKARDVAAGGGTAGRAPAKFKTFRELNEHAYKGMVGGS